MSEPNQSGLSDNAAGALAYITFVPAIVFLVLPPYNASPYVRFHAWNSILLNVAAVIVDIAFTMLLMFTAALTPLGYFGTGRLLWPLLELLWFVLWLVCVLQAVNGKRFKLPVLGPIAEQLANK
jgi:uncharacterized membrane protein